MFQFLGYNFLADGDALASAPSEVNQITDTVIKNAIFDHFNVTKDTNADIDHTGTKPSEWDYDTIMNANLDGNLSAGNVDLLIEEISAIKIKRRVSGTFDWITLNTIPINSVEDLHFTFIDRLNANYVEYDYAFVPVINDMEGDYIINSVLSHFKGIFIGDAEEMYKLLYNVEYGSIQRNQQIGTFEPLGRKYPVLVGNSQLSYDTGSVNAAILNEDFEFSGRIDRLDIAKKVKTIQDFFTNKKAKFLKDWNGNEWLCFISGNPQITYKERSGMAVPNVTFDWTEIGDPSNQQDLYRTGMITEAE